MRQKIPLLLSVFNVALALILGLWDGLQVKYDIWGGHAVDHVPAAEFTLHLVNLPVALLIAGIFKKWSFQIIPEYSPVIFVGYVLLIALFWFLIGLRIASPGSFPRLRSVVLEFSRVPGIVLGAITLLMGVVLIHSPLGLLIPITAFLWGLVILFIFGRRSAGGWPGL
jgi:hypothetical protein